MPGPAFKMQCKTFLHCRMVGFCQRPTHRPHAPTDAPTDTKPAPKGHREFPLVPHGRVPMIAPHQDLPTPRPHVTTRISFMRKLAAGNWKMNGTTASLSEVASLMAAHPAPGCEMLL